MNTARRLLLFCILGGALIGGGPAMGGTTKDETTPAATSVIWKDGEGGLAAHHVYGLCLTTKGTLLAFCEGRIGRLDYDPHHILGKRSTDRGQTWSDNIFVCRSTKNECLSNPTPVVDQATGLIFLFYGRNLENQRSEVLYVTSKDDGLTWSAPTDLTALFTDDPLKRPFHLPGPGHGIQLRNGRLVLPVWHRTAISRDFKNPPWDQRLYAICTLYSDDHGQTWRRGDYLSAEKPSNESRLVELIDGSLLLNARGLGYLTEGNRWRVVARSTNGGQSWSEPVVDKSAGEFTPCDAGLIRLTRGPWRDTDTLLFSRPDHPDARVNQTISVSLDGGRTWPHNRRISAAGGYSDLVELDDGVVGMLFGTYDEQDLGVFFTRIAVNDLLKEEPKP